jgi:tRNA modification GTPase
LIASVYAFIDYPDEDMTDVSVEEMRERLAAICRETETLCDSHAYGKAISEGIPVCILGKPNTGKSALLNALAREERAIVTAIPGTTRDVVKEQVRLGDLLLNLSDTAGIRDSEDVVEQIGIQRSVRSLEEAELVLAMFDGSRPFDEEDEKVLKLIRESGKEEQTVYLMNKSDLQEDASVRTSLPKTPVVISAMEKTGLEALEAAVKERFGHVDTRSLGEIVVGARQFAALTKAKKHMQDALHTLEGFSQDMAGLDMEQALQALEEVDGKTASDEIVSEIFSHFCVGK